MSREKKKRAQFLCFRRSTFRVFLYTNFIIAYLSMGAACFMWLELPYEKNEARLLVMKREAFLRRQSCVSANALDEFMGAVVQASGRGVTMVGNETSPSNWDFGHSFFFAMTVVTTIGYGQTTPLSGVGKGFCILYALIGIPITLVFFAAIMERLYKPTRKLLVFMQEELREQYKPFDIRLLHLSIVGTFVGVFFVVVPSIILAYLEPDWNFLDSVYYCFISLSTIGLGDFVPGENAPEDTKTLYKVIVTIYLFIGLVATLLFLQVFYEIPELNFGNNIYLSFDEIPIKPEEIPMTPTNPNSGADHRPETSERAKLLEDTSDG